MLTLFMICHMKSGKEILDMLLDYLGMTPYEFSKKIGYNRPQIIYDIQSGKTKSISKTLIEKIIEVYPELNTSWLLSGDGEILKFEKAINEVVFTGHDLISRIRDIMDHYNLNISQFAEKTGLGQGNLSSMLKGSRTIGLGVLNKIIIAFEDINKDWLFDGKGEMLKSKHKQETITQNSNELISYLKDTIREKDDEIGRLKEEVGRLKGILDKNNIEHRQTGS